MRKTIGSFYSVSIIFTTICCISAEVTQIYDVVKLGAKPDGKTDCTQAFINTWATACGSYEPAIIYVTRGRYLLKNIAFKGPCNNSDITFLINGTLIAPSYYTVIRKIENWLSFEWVIGVSIYGGTLDGRGTDLWACKAAKGNCPEGTTSLRFTNSNDVVINGLKSLNSQMFHIAINRCQNVNMQNVTIIARGDSPNTDGIHVQLSTNVSIMRSGIKTGDDCISIGPGTKNLWIQNIACGPGHGISIGSLGKGLDEPGVENVTVKTVVFTGTQNGMRIKTWGRPSNGFVKGVMFQHVLLKNVKNPIVIDPDYCPRSENCPNQVSGINISDITYQDIKGTSATRVAIKLECSSMNPCNAIRLNDVKLTYKDKPALTSCTNADVSADGFPRPDICL